MTGSGTTVFDINRGEIVYLTESGRQQLATRELDERTDTMVESRTDTDRRPYDQRVDRNRTPGPSAAPSSSDRSKQKQAKPRPSSGLGQFGQDQPSGTSHDFCTDLT